METESELNSISDELKGTKLVNFDKLGFFGILSSRFFIF